LSVTIIDCDRYNLLAGSWLIRAEIHKLTLNNAWTLTCCRRLDWRLQINELYKLLQPRKSGVDQISPDVSGSSVFWGSIKNCVKVVYTSTGCAARTIAQGNSTAINIRNSRKRSWYTKKNSQTRLYKLSKTEQKSKFSKYVVKRLVRIQRRLKNCTTKTSSPKRLSIVNYQTIKMVNQEK